MCVCVSVRDRGREKERDDGVLGKGKGPWRHELKGAGFLQVSTGCDWAWQPG